jgi:hypothetical protein
MFYEIIIFILSVFGVATSAIGLKNVTDKKSTTYKFLIFCTVLFSIIVGSLIFFAGYKLSQPSGPVRVVPAPRAPPVQVVRMAPANQATSS